MYRIINNANPIFPSNYYKSLDNFDVNQDGLIDFEDFINIEKKFPLVFYPLFFIQDRIQQETFGIDTWTHILRDYTYAKYVEDYKLNHGGHKPNLSTSQWIEKYLCPCFFYTYNVNVHLSSELENRKSTFLKSR